MVIMKIGMMILEVYPIFLLARAIVLAKTGEYPRTYPTLHSPIFNHLSTMIKAVV